MDEERALRNSFAELAARAAEGSYYTYSDFLTLAEQDTLQSMQLPTAFTLTGGYDGAERRIAVFGSEQEFGYHPEPPLAYIRIAVRAPRFAEPLSHRDYLGSILGLGLERDVTGDILPAENEAYLICLDTVADFIAESLVKVRHTDVECTRISELPPVSVPEPVECTVFAASERADALARRYGDSRAVKANRFFPQSSYLRTQDWSQPPMRASDPAPRYRCAGTANSYIAAFQRPRARDVCA